MLIYYRAVLNCGSQLPLEDLALLGKGAFNIYHTYMPTYYHCCTLKRPITPLRGIPTPCPPSHYFFHSKAILFYVLAPIDYLNVPYILQ